jgi:nucleoside-diphosphate-sugar epimerase
MGMNILVTGANGFVGRNIINRLANNPGLHIIATDLHPSPTYLEPGNPPPNLTYLNGDLATKAFNAEVRTKFTYDCIIHLAAILSQAEDMKTYFSVMDSNINTTFLLLETARQHKARFLFPSTALVYGNKPAPFSESMIPDPEVFYALSKHMSEELIRFYGNKYALSYVIFRIGVLYGPGQFGSMFIPSLITSLLEGKEFAMTGGKQVRDFLFINDFFDIIEKALNHHDISGVFNLGTGRAPTMKEVAQMAEELTGVRGKIKLGAISYRAEEVWEYCLDNKKVCQTFQWSPRTTLAEGIAQTIRFHQDRMKKAEFAMQA